MIGLIVVFVDKRAKKFTVFQNQNAYKWSQLFYSLNHKEYSMRSFGGSRKEANSLAYTKKLKSIGFRENFENIDFEKIKEPDF